MATPLSRDLLHRMDAYWRAANYLSVGQIYLYDNPLLRTPLRPAHVKPRLLGHWGTTPGQNFIYVHLNRVVREHDLDMIYVAGPGHGGPALVANTYLEGTYSELYPAISQDEDGLKRLFKQFSFPGGIPSHVAPETPGSIHEGGELGYSLSHAFISSASTSARSPRSWAGSTPSSSRAGSASTPRQCAGKCVPDSRISASASIPSGTPAMARSSVPTTAPARSG